MRPVGCLAVVFLLVSSSIVHAQVKGSVDGKSVCGSASVQQTILVNDDQQHSISIGQRPCTWKTPIEIDGMTSTEYVSYGVDDVQDGHSVDQGYAVGTVKNGDRYFLRYEGTATMNGNIPEHLEGKWRFTGGTGRLRHLRGSGSYTARPTAEGGMEFAIQGSYEVP